MRHLPRRAAWVLLPAFAACASPPPSPPEPPQHLIVVCVDTLRADHVGAWGYGRDTTPTIDALAARGALFADTVATSPWTVPSVASLFTSLLPRRHGAGTAGDVRFLREGEAPAQIPPIVPTLAKVLVRNGYRTGLLSANPFLYGRFKDGFEHAHVERIDATRLTDEALSWLAEADPRPVFLYLQYMDAHQPNLPPDPYFQIFPASDGRPHGREHSDWSYGQVTDLEDPGFRTFREHRIAVYDGAVRYLDAELGRLVARLDRPPFRGRTTLVVTADHGEEFWDHVLEEGRRADDPRKLWGIGHGHSMYQELLRVPLLFVGPGIEPGRRDPCPASILDIAPTLLARAGLPPLPHQQGIDLGERLAGLGSDCRPRARIAASPAYGPNSAAILLDGWKAVEAFGRPPELFDLRSDPAERHDLASDQRRRLAALLAILRRAQPIDSKTQGPSGPVPAELTEELRALGYL